MWFKQVTTLCHCLSSMQLAPKVSCQYPCNMLYSIPQYANDTPLQPGGSHISSILYVKNHLCFNSSTLLLFVFRLLNYRNISTDRTPTLPPTLRAAVTATAEPLIPSPTETPAPSPPPPTRHRPRAYRSINPGFRPQMEASPPV